MSLSPKRRWDWGLAGTPSGAGCGRATRPRSSAADRAPRPYPAALRARRERGRGQVKRIGCLAHGASLAAPITDEYPRIPAMSTILVILAFIAFVLAAIG